MNLWLWALVSLGCAVAGVACGHWFSRLRGPFWTIGYFIPLVFVIAYALAFHFPSVMFAPPFSWLTIGVKKFAGFSFLTSMVLTTPLARLPQPRTRRFVAFLMVFIVFFMGIWPFIAPMLDRKQLSHLQTNIDKNGVCLQTTDYTCGPASAVTALRKLGLPADEGPIAILSCTSAIEGTPPDMLAEGLNRRYATDGLTAECRVFHNIGELKAAGLTLAVIKFGFLVDHWVTVLSVTDSQVIVGDPNGGLSRLSYEDFAERWRFVGVVLRRQPPG